jgi:hypothetical protein
MAIAETIFINGSPQKREFTGLAADTKPTASIPPNSTFKECDTGKSFIWNGSEWVENT